MRRCASRVIAVALGLLPLTVSGCASATSAALKPPSQVQEPASRIRRIYRMERPIAEALLPDDDIVEVVWEVDETVFDREPTPQQMLRGLGQRADLVVAVDVQDISGVLVDDGKWIATLFTGIVVDVLGRSGTEFVAAGQPVAAGMGSGESTIGTVRVRAGNVVPYPSNRRYLMFLGQRSSEILGVFNLIYAPLLIENERLTAVLGPKSNELDGKLHGMSMRDVTRQLQQIKQ
jgi:hypothetical protein